MKRSDITTKVVLEVYSREHKDKYPVDETLSRETDAPIKVCWAAMEREEDKGYIDCGMNLNGGWLTELGQGKLKSIYLQEKLRLSGKWTPIEFIPDDLKEADLVVDGVRRCDAYKGQYGWTAGGICMGEYDHPFEENNLNPTHYMEIPELPEKEQE